MKNLINQFKTFTYHDWLIVFFPICLLLRSTITNVYIVFLGIVFVFNFFKKKYLFKNIDFKWVKYFFIFYFYIVLRAFFAQNNLEALHSSISQIRFIFFSLFIYTCISSKKNFILILKIYLIILILVSFDGLVQFLTGKDIFGYHGMNNEMALRLSGPFGDELIIGSYLVFLSIPIISYLYFNYQNKGLLHKNLFIFFSFLIFLVVFLSGERMSFIILFFNYLIIFFIGSNFKKFIFAITSMCLLVIVIYFNHNSVNKRINEFIYDISNFKNSGHGRLFFSAYSLWNENKIFGVGLKNYRIICDPSSFNQYTNQKEICSTHPHNFLAEILVETGVFGLFFLTLFLFNVLRFILLNLKNIQNKEYNSIIYGSLFVVLIYIWPIRSSGSFFSTWNASFFWFNFGLALYFSRKASN